MISLLASLFLISFSAQAQTPSDATDVSDPARVQQEVSCTPNVSAADYANLNTVGVCSPMALAAGASAAPRASAGLARILGRWGGRMAAGANIVGLGLGAIEVFGLFKSGLASIEQCRQHEIEFKRHIINQVVERGRQFETALDNASDQIGELTEQQRRQLKFPAPYMTEERIRSAYCGELVNFAERIKERQNRVYLEKTTGTMVIVPLPPEPTRDVSSSDQRMIDMIMESLSCLPPREYLEGVCAVGNFVLFGTPLQSKIIERMNRHHNLGVSEPMGPRANTTRAQPPDPEDVTSGPAPRTNAADDFETSTDIQTREAFEEIRNRERLVTDARSSRYPIALGQRVNVGGQNVTLKERLGEGMEGYVYRVETDDGRSMTLKVFQDPFQANANINGLNRMRDALGTGSVVGVRGVDPSRTQVLLDYVHGSDLDSILSHASVPAQTKMRLQIQFEDLQRRARASGIEPPPIFNIIVRESDMSLVVIDPF